MGNRQYSELEVIRGCRKGKRQAQEMLYRHYYSFGMSVCLRYAYSRDDALEILNDSFMKVFQHINNFDEARPFKSWFRRIMVNTALDHYRSARRFQLHVSLEDLNPDAMEIYEAAPVYDTDLKMNTEEILGLFNSLPEVYRISFNLYEIEGYSHDEIAGMMDISPGTSRSNLSRAKKMLRMLYDKQMNEARHEAV